MVRGWVIVTVVIVPGVNASLGFMEWGDVRATC